MIEHHKKDFPKKVRLERKRKLKRDIITSMAEQHFVKKGYENTKIDEIAFDIGYTKATVYNYFESKEDIFAAILSKTYITMFDSMKSFLDSSDSVNALRALANAYFFFVKSYPDKTDLLDSAVCVTINKRIIEKEEQNESLTESENEFKDNELRVANLMMDLIAQFTKETGINDKIQQIKIIKALSSINFTVREVIRRARVTKQSEEETNEILDILFTLIERGVKQYVTN